MANPDSIHQNSPGPLCCLTNVFSGVAGAWAESADLVNAKTAAREKARVEAKRLFDIDEAKNCPNNCNNNQSRTGGSVAPVVKDVFSFENTQNSKWVAFAISYYHSRIKCRGGTKAETGVNISEFATIEYLSGGGECGKKSYWSQLKIVCASAQNTTLAVERASQLAQDSASYGVNLFRTAVGCPKGCRPGIKTEKAPPNPSEIESIKIKNPVRSVQLLQSKGTPHERIAYVMTYWWVALECPKKE